LTTLLVDFTPIIGLHGGPPNNPQNVCKSSIIATYVVKGGVSGTVTNQFVIFECGYQAIVDSNVGSGKPTSWNGDSRPLSLEVDPSVNEMTIEITFDMGNSGPFREKKTSTFFLIRQRGAGATGFQVLQGATDVGSVAIGSGCETNISKTFIDTTRGWTAVVVTKFRLLPRGG